VSKPEDPPPDAPAEPSIYAETANDFYDPPPAPADRNEAPIVEAPIVEAPIVDARTGDAPIGETRTGDAPIGETRTGDATTGEARTGDAPIVEASASDLAPRRDHTPILPHAVDLREAVGAPTKKSKVERNDDAQAPPSNRKVMTIAAASIFVGLLTLTLILLGRANAQRYFITCTTDQVRAERGRAFPPWGSQLMGGNAYKPIALPANAECKPQETQDLAELEHWYLDVLLERASATLTAPVLDAPDKPLDVAEGELNQALLLSRAPERRDQRKEVERLLGDVQYWRASLRLRDASAALSEAAKQFEAAAAQRPRHVTDAGSWAAFLERVVDELHAGPDGIAATGPTATTASPTNVAPPTAPLGTALPVEPTPTPSPTDPAPVDAKPDAGVPTGGVLL
jgi:hypothetical protein